MSDKMRSPMLKDQLAPPSEGELQESFETIRELAQSPGGQARISTMLAKRFSQPTEVELNNPRYTPLLTAEPGLDD